MSLFSDLLAKTKKMAPFMGRVNSVVGIDIGTSAIKVVQVRNQQGKIELETYGELGLGSYGNETAGRVVTLGPDVIAKAVADILHESNVTTKSAVLSIQSQATLVFLLELPEVSDSELASIIPNEARKYIPVPLTEVSLDWYAVPRKETYAQEAASEGDANRKKVEVVVVAVRNETLSQYRDIAQKSGIELRGEEIEVFSAIRSGFHREIAPTMIIDYGASTTKVAIVEYGVVRAYHVINRGSAFVTESLARSMNIEFAKAEELKKTVGLSGTSIALAGIDTGALSQTILVDTQYLMSEMQTILLQYERQSHKAVTKIILIGGGSSMPGFMEKIGAEFGVETILGDPFDKTNAPEFMRPVLKKAGPEFAVAVGLALKDFI